MTSTYNRAINIAVDDLDVEAFLDSSEQALLQAIVDFRLHPMAMADEAAAVIEKEGGIRAGSPRLYEMALDYLDGDIIQIEKDIQDD